MENNEKGLVENFKLTLIKEIINMSDRQIMQMIRSALLRQQEEYNTTKRGEEDSNDINTST